MNNFTKRCVAAFASLTMAGTLCAAGAVTVSSVAWASKPGVNQGGGSQPQGGNPSQAAVPEKAPWELGTAASTKTGSITINKWEDEVEGGKQKKSKPVSGAEFTVKKVTQIGNDTIDLTKYADWVKVANQIDKLNKNTATVTTETGNGTTKNTSGTDQGAQKGVAKFENLKIGLYQVKETTVPKGYSASESKPFYITIPMIEKGDGDKVVYNYNPSVDPKNKNLKKCVKKTADTSETVGAGDKIKYTISAELDKMKEAGAADLTAADFNGYSVVDLAPADAFTTYDASVVKTVNVGTDDTNKSNTELKNEDSKKYYEVGTATDVPAVTSGDNQDVARKKIPITFTEEGRKKLAEEANKTANAGKTVKVFVTLEFTLKDSTTLGNSTVTNKGGLIPSHGDGDNPDVVTGDENQKVEFLKFKIKKVSATDNKGLQGGKFVIFAKETDAKACTAELNKANGDVTNKCGVNSSRSAFGEKESAKDTGLTEEYSLVKDNKTFYIVETAAPAGYIRNPDPVAVEAKDTNATYTFQNLPNKDNGFWFNLPKTGAAGVILFALAGVCFVGAGFVVYIHRRKKEEEQAKLRA
ncbi:SpaH/EbpB family LPXTG-anchored major pilin [Gardnerella vaginalis]|uniref:SpaH/EbpB family LPXTG-anchored major pilin n=1 Tax=Gardnerella vaginalis TaxID=2702 RepID=UPI001FF34254|nr:SpaH/EbpB family LPXTG-anchored major pilin [Gardnerella vaginalis]